MADTKITALTALAEAPAASDVIALVDVSDTSMAGSGTTKKNTVSNLLSKLPGTLDANSQDITNLGGVSFASLVNNGNSGAADTIDWTAGNKQKSTLTADCTFTFTAPNGVTSLTLQLIQDGTGEWDATWPASVKWPDGEPTWSSDTAGKKRIVSFFYDGTDYIAQATSAY